ncbi:helix-turn-helix domain-containing protein [Streptomyces sp. MMS24-I29]|uniref:helix-turn-helix domain-containing protein n=1 Tax=Streptomyces sp. MMS24-I29 TaxID=3351480 RepID=UPI003C7DB712
MSHSGPSAVAITLSEAERAELARRAKMPHRRSAEKARIILACADGMSNTRVARLVGVQAKTVGKWRRVFAAERMAGLEDAGWIGRPKADLILDDAGASWCTPSSSAMRRITGFGSAVRYIRTARSRNFSGYFLGAGIVWAPLVKPI